MKCLTSSCFVLFAVIGHYVTLVVDANDGRPTRIRKKIFEKIFYDFTPPVPLYLVDPTKYLNIDIGKNVDADKFLVQLITEYQSGSLKGFDGKDTKLPKELIQKLVHSNLKSKWEGKILKTELDGPLTHALNNRPKHYPLTTPYPPAKAEPTFTPLEVYTQHPRPLPEYEDAGVRRTPSQYGMPSAPIEPRSDKVFFTTKSKNSTYQVIMRRFYDRPQGAKGIMITGRGKSEDNNEMAIKMDMMTLTTTPPPTTPASSSIETTSPSSFIPLPPPTSTEDDIMMMGSPIMPPFPPAETTTPMTTPMVSRKLRSS